jgi:hypothetical protein
MNTINTLSLPTIEILAEAECADFRREVEQVRLVHEALKTTPRQPSWLERRVLTLSAWMVDTGQRLSRRYQNADPIPRRYPSFKIAR